MALPVDETSAEVPDASDGRSDPASAPTVTELPGLSGEPLPLSHSTVSHHPDRIGDYRILSLLGEGGMGAVYRAEQQHPRRLVALKMIRPLMGGRAALRRFRMEAETLGRLEHPGIARIYEAGTATTGSGLQPFFAMELVDGLPLRQYADHKRLDIRQRLDLLARVCDAVQYAHQKGVIHRDLKPANVLVTHDGQPKVLDFGVARVIDSEGSTLGGGAAQSLQTQSGQLLGTLRYMSPEQADGQSHEVDTRSDVYALGVIGYELLVDRLPYELDGRPLADMLRMIREAEPSRLSSINRSLRGDVETILLKALEKEKSRRYGSAADLAADIRRHLSYEPITARPPTTWYQLSRFARRNKILVGGVIATMLALVVGIGMSTYQAYRATRAEQSITIEQKKTVHEKNAAVRERIKADRRAAELLIAAGQKSLETGDASLALLQFVRALKTDELDAPDPDRAAASRYRIGMTFPRVHRLIDMRKPIPQGVFAAGHRRLAQSAGKELVIKAADTGKEISRIRLPGPVLPGQFDIEPGGRWVATAADGSIQLWNADTGQLRTKPVPAPDAPFLKFSPDGKWLAASGDDFNLSLIDPMTGRRRSLGSHSNYGFPGAFSASGRYLASAAQGGEILICDLTRPDQAGPLHRLSSLGNPSWLRFSPDERILWSASDFSRYWMWDVETGQRLIGPISANVGEALTFTADSRQAVIIADGIVNMVEVSTGQRTTSLIKPVSWTLDARTDTDDPRLLVLTAPVGRGESSSYTTTVVQPAPERAARLELRDQEPGTFCTITADGSRILSASVSGARLLDGRTGRPLLPVLDYLDWKSLPGASHDPVGQPFKDACLSHDGRRIAVAAIGWAAVFDAETGAPMRLLGTPADASIATVSFDPTGRKVVFASDTATEASVMDSDDERVAVATIRHDEVCRGAWFSPDGKTIATVSSGKAFPGVAPEIDFVQLRLWDAATLRPISSSAAGPVSQLIHPTAGQRSAVAFTPDSRWVVTAGFAPSDYPLPRWPPGDGATAATVPIPAKASPSLNTRILVHTWDVRTGRLAAPPIIIDDLEHIAFCPTLSISPDSRYLAISGIGNSVLVRELKTGLPVSPALTHRFLIQDAAFSPDGRLVATAGGDRTVQLWDWRTGLTASPPLVHHQGVVRLAFSGDGRQLVTRSVDATSVWDIIQAEEPREQLEALAELLASRRLDESGNVALLTPEEWDVNWSDFRTRTPARFRPPAPTTRPAEPFDSYAGALSRMNNGRLGFHLYREFTGGNGVELLAVARRAAAEKVANDPATLLLPIGYVLADRYADAEPLFRRDRGRPLRRVHYPYAPADTFGEAWLDMTTRLPEWGIDHPDLPRVAKLLRQIRATNQPATRPTADAATRGRP